VPLINVIPGEKIPVAPMNIRLPAWRVPGWLLVFWWLLRGLVRVTVLAVRYWWLTGPAGVGLWVHARYGGLILAGVVLAVTAACLGWWPVASAILAAVWLVPGRCPLAAALGLPAGLGLDHGNLRPGNRVRRRPVRPATPAGPMRPVRR
jgi:hypothetical protein